VGEQHAGSAACARGALATISLKGAAPWHAQVAVVRSAVKLEQEQQFLIAKKLQELTGSKNIKLRPMIDTVSHQQGQMDKNLSVRTGEEDIGGGGHMALLLCAGP
jgi:hypothetical protein